MFKRENAQQKAEKRASRTFSSETIDQVRQEGLEKVDMAKTVASMDKIKIMIQEYRNQITGDSAASQRMKSLLDNVVNDLTQVIEERANADEKMLKLNDIAMKVQMIEAKFKTLKKIFTMNSRQKLREQIKGQAMALKKELDNVKDTFDNGEDPAYKSIKSEVLTILNKLDTGKGKKQLLDIDEEEGTFDTYIPSSGPPRKKFLGLFGGKKTRKQRNRRTRRKAKKNRRTRRNRA